MDALFNLLSALLGAGVGGALTYWATVRQDRRARSINAMEEFYLAASALVDSTTPYAYETSPAPKVTLNEVWAMTLKLDLYCPKAVTERARALTGKMFEINDDAPFHTLTDVTQVKEWNELEILRHDYEVAMRRAAGVDPPSHPPVQLPAPVDLPVLRRPHPKD